LIQHRLPVMRDQDTILIGGNLQNLRIRNFPEMALGSRCELNCRFAPPNGQYNSEVDIGIGHEPT
jgi:hypothetical protein